MKCGKKTRMGKKAKSKKIPTPKAGRQKGNAKSQSMRKRSAY